MYHVRKIAHYNINATDTSSGGVEISCCCASPVLPDESVMIALIITYACGSAGSADPPPAARSHPPLSCVLLKHQHVLLTLATDL